MPPTNYYTLIETFLKVYLQRLRKCDIKFNCKIDAQNKNDLNFGRLKFRDQELVQVTLAFS